MYSYFRILRYAVLLLSGALVPFALAPYDIWPLSIAPVVTLAFCLMRFPAASTFWQSFAFGAGLFGSGTSWVYVSIHDFGFTGTVLAILLTAVFVLGLALVFAFPFYLFSRWASWQSRWSGTLGFAAVWVLGEWVRSWFLTGFPWLYLGYAHVESPFSGWAPVLGVFGLGFIVTLLAAMLACCLSLALRKNSHQAPTFVFLSRDFDRRHAGLFSLAFIGVIAASVGLKNISWVSVNQQKPLSVALVQPNIPLEVKWNPLFAPQITETLQALTEPYWASTDLIIWPEAAIPYLYHESESILDQLDERAKATQTAFMTGILFDDLDNEKYFNSILGLGEGRGMYFKQRLVPFGEYVPLEQWLRGLIAFFDLPNSVIHAGSSHQEALQAHGYNVAPFICYEVVYPDFVAKYGQGADVFVTISNDAWFGRSAGPLQHYQMAQMRALENGRYMIRVTNTGLSGVINHMGRTVSQLPQFSSESARVDVFVVEGETPFSSWGSKPIVIFSFILLIFPLLKRRSLASESPR